MKHKEQKCKDVLEGIAHPFAVIVGSIASLIMGGFLILITSVAHIAECFGIGKKGR